MIVQSRKSCVCDKKGTNRFRVSQNKSAYFSSTTQAVSPVLKLYSRALLTFHGSLLGERGLLHSTSPAALKCLTLYVLSLQTVIFTLCVQQQLVSRSWISNLLFLALPSKCFRLKQGSGTLPHLNNTTKHVHWSLLRGFLVQLSITRETTQFVLLLIVDILISYGLLCSKTYLKQS